MIAAPSPPLGSEHTIVISSGRCGSTLIADMIGAHPEVLPLIEFFGSQYQAGLTRDALDGVEFWRLLNTPWLSLDTALRLDWVPGEVRYPLPSAPPYPSLPGLLAFTLPAITSTPDELYRQLGVEICGWPRRPAGAHYRALFERLLAASGCRRWVEKSAASPEYADDLVDLLPGARIVLLSRDVIDVAISMTHHPMFVFVDLSVLFQQRCGFDPFVVGSRPIDAVVPDDLRALLPENLTRAALDARAGSPASLMNLVVAQAEMSRLADAAVDRVDPRLVYRLRYEDVVADPVPTLTALGEFLELPSAAEWARTAAAQVRPARPPRIAVSAAERSMLMGLYEQVYAATAVPAAVSSPAPVPAAPVPVALAS